MALSPEEKRRRKRENQARYRQRRREQGIGETPEQRITRQRHQREYESRKRVADPEGFHQAQIEAAKRYRDRHPDRVKAATTKWRSENRDQYNAIRRAGRTKNWLNYILKDARNRAKRAGLEFTITADDVPPMGKRCPVFGYPFIKPEMGKGPFSPSLDRIDSRRGYVPGNIWIISDRANRVKNDGTAEEHELIAKAMRARGVK